MASFGTPVGRLRRSLARWQPQYLGANPGFRKAAEWHADMSTAHAIIGDLGRDLIDMGTTKGHGEPAPPSKALLRHSQARPTRERMRRLVRWPLDDGAKVDDLPLKLVRVLNSVTSRRCSTPTPNMLVGIPPFPIPAANAHAWQIWE